jgi:hypothetical protein
MQDSTRLMQHAHTETRAVRGHNTVGFAACVLQDSGAQCRWWWRWCVCVGGRRDSGARPWDARIEHFIRISLARLGMQHGCLQPMHICSPPIRLTIDPIVMIMAKFHSTLSSFFTCPTCCDQLCRAYQTVRTIPSHHITSHHITSHHITCASSPEAQHVGVLVVCLSGVVVHHIKQHLDAMLMQPVCIVHAWTAWVDSQG